MTQLRNKTFFPLLLKSAEPLIIKLISWGKRVTKIKFVNTGISQLWACDKRMSVIAIPKIGSMHEEVWRNDKNQASLGEGSGDR